MSKKNRLTREQAAEIYDQLRVSMEKRYGKEGLKTLMNKEQAMESIANGGGIGLPEMPTRTTVSSQTSKRFSVQTGNAGVRAAFALVICVAGLKTGLSALEVSGIAGVDTVDASTQIITRDSTSPKSFQHFTSDEIKLLKSLDARRVEIEERSDRLERRAEELGQKDRELAARLTELRELTQKIEGERKKSERKQTAQIDQLANVYGSMNPVESARLIEQLDVTISLQLLERMPEKRIAQILAVMSPEQALALTRMLSGSRS